MKIGLIDVDGHHFPNLALMKISSFHKAIGDSVEWCNHLEGYDRVYKSKVFTFTPDERTAVNARKVITGGTGYRDYDTVLPDSVEHIEPDYGLYGIDYAVGFTTRGCVNHCPWCVMPFAQPYRDFDNMTEPTQEQKDLARWCNMKATFKSCTFEEYNRNKK